MKLTKKQAKVGLWVRDPIGNVSQLLKGGLGLHSGSYYAFEDCSLWEPLNGEWCWFWDKEEPLRLGKFSHMFEKYFVMHDAFGFGNEFMNCEPFIGKLPTLLNNKKVQDEQ